MSRTISLLFVTFFFVAVSTSLADSKPIKPIKEWSGSVTDAELSKDAQEFITGADALEKMWTSWKLEDKLPKVDFDKELVIVATTVGSKLSLFANLDEKGNLKVGGVATRDIVPGFRYMIATISRDGIKAVNGKELKK